MYSIGLFESVSDGISERKGFIATAKEELIVVCYLQITTKLRNSTNLIRRGGGGHCIFTVVFMYLLNTTCVM